MDNRESVLIYRSVWEAIQLQPVKVRAEAWDAIMCYAFTGEDPQKIGPAAKGFYLIVKPLLDANSRRRENGAAGAEHGLKGGRPKKQPRENPIGVINNVKTGGNENPIGVISGEESEENKNPIGVIKNAKEKPLNRNRNRIKDKEEDINNRTWTLEKDQGQGNKTPPPPFEGGAERADPPDPALVGKVQGVVTEELRQALEDFGKYRKAIKKPLTDRGQELVVMQLEKMAPGDTAMQVAILEQSIANGWRGIFPLKEQPAVSAAKSGNPFLDLVNEYDAAEKAASKGADGNG